MAEYRRSLLHEAEGGQPSESDYGRQLKRNGVLLQGTQLLFPTISQNSERTGTIQPRAALVTPVIPRRGYSGESSIEDQPPITPTRLNRSKR